MKVVVIGGTGLIGSKVVELLASRGHRGVAAAPATGVDTLTGEGLAEVLTGASVVVDVSNSPSFEAAAALEFFRTSTRNLLAAGSAARVVHHLALSVVGTERLSESGYFRAKAAQEELIAASPLQHTIVHATQFFEFVNRIADEATEGDTVRVAPVRIQPMAADDVAAAICELVLGAPLMGVVEVAGPEQFKLDELVRHALAVRGDPRQVTADPDARYFGARLTDDMLLPGADARLGATRFDDWLARSTPTG